MTIWNVKVVGLIQKARFRYKKLLRGFNLIIGILIKSRWRQDALPGKVIAFAKKLTLFENNLRESFG